MGEDDFRTTEIEEAKAQVVRNVIQLRQRISESDVSDEHAWFRNLLCGILNCALDDYRSVKTGVERSIPLAAWGRRNLLELKVVTEYVLASEANALDLRSDLILDAKEFYEAVSLSHKSSHKQYLTLLSEFVSKEEGPMKALLEDALRRDSEQGPQTAVSDSEAETLKQFLSSIGVKGSAKPKLASTVAQLLGSDQKEDFAPMNKICSKLMHRTAMSIASSTVQGSLDEMIPFLEMSAFTDLLSIHDRINHHIETIGVRGRYKESKVVNHERRRNQENSNQ